MDDIGHFAGGYAAAKLYLKNTYPQLNRQQKERLAVIGGIFSVTPDLDALFCVFSKPKGYSWNPWKDPFKHHQFVSHTPAFYTSLFGILLLIARSVHSKTFELYAELFYLGAMTHFLLDSFESDGIAWLYPLSKKQVAVSLTKDYGIKHWRRYYTRASGLIELGILIAAGVLKTLSVRTESREIGYQQNLISSRGLGKANDIANPLTH